MMCVYINGKFLAQRTTGVQRVARCLVQGLDSLGDQLPGRWVLLCPAGVEVPMYRQVEARPLGPLPRGHGAWALHAWEQAVLPSVTRDGWLLCLAGSSPWFGLRQINLLHDAAVFDCQHHYSKAFAIWYKKLFLRLGRANVGGGALLTVSAFSRERLAKHLGVDGSSIAIVPGAGDHLDNVIADGSVLRALRLNGTRYLIAVGSDQPTKNFSRLMAAYARLEIAASCRLVIVGGRDRRVFAKTGDDRDPPGVIRAGVRSDEELKALYEHASALVLPSLYEGFGLPAVEAMRRGCPVIASSSGALPEVCAGAAIFIDPTSIDDIARAIERVLGDTALRDRLRMVGRQRASRFTWAASAKRLLAVMPPEALA